MAWPSILAVCMRMPFWDCRLLRWQRFLRGIQPRVRIRYQCADRELPHRDYRRLRSSQKLPDRQQRQLQPLLQVLRVFSRKNYGASTVVTVTVCECRDSVRMIRVQGRDRQSRETRQASSRCRWEKSTNQRLTILFYWYICFSPCCK